jgi:hypothetical protein
MLKHSYQITKRLPFTPDGPQFYQMVLDAGVQLATVIVFLRGQIVISAGTTSGVAVGEQQGGLVQRIKVEADAAPGGLYNGGEIVSLTPRTFARRRLFDRGVLPVDLLTPNLTGAAGTFNVNYGFEIDFAIPQSVKPFDTALRLDQFTNVTLQLFGSHLSAMLTGNDRTVNYNGLFYDIVEIREYAPDFYPAAVLYQDDRFHVINAANTRDSIDAELPKTETYAEVLLIAETTNQALSDAVINRVTVYSGSEVEADLYSDHWKWIQQRYAGPSQFGANLVGLYKIPIAQGGDANATLLTGCLPNIKLLCDVSNPGGAGVDRLTVATRRLSPIKAQPKKATA